MKESGKFELIFADVQQDGSFIEQQAERVDVNGAMTFIAKTFNKAMTKQRIYASPRKKNR